jgi:hypothetical protein
MDMLGMVPLYANRSASSSNLIASPGSMAPRSNPQAPSPKSIEPHIG